MSTASQNDRIWSGDDTTAEEAKSRFDAGEISIVKYASTLYSFRDREEYRQRLIDQRRMLIVHALGFRPNVDNPLKTADQADVLSTVLHWLSRQPELIRPDRDACLQAANVMVQHGIELLEEQFYGPERHTLSLLRLTQAAILLEKGERGTEVWKLLYMTAAAAPLVADVRQRSRVYWKLGTTLSAIWTASAGLLVAFQDIVCAWLRFSPRRLAAAPLALADLSMFARTLQKGRLSGGALFTCYTTCI